MSVINRLASNLHKCIKVLFFLNHRRRTPPRRRAAPTCSPGCAAPSPVSWGGPGGHRAPLPHHGGHIRAGGGEDAREVSATLLARLGFAKAAQAQHPALQAGTWRAVQPRRGADTRWGQPISPHCWCVEQRRRSAYWDALLAAKGLLAAMLAMTAVRCESLARCLASLLLVCCKGLREYARRCVVSHVQRGMHLTLVPFCVSYQALRCLTVIADRSTCGEANS